MQVKLEKCPGIRDLEDAYNQILSATRAKHLEIDLHCFAKFCQWSRFDSRMGEINVQFLSENWNHIDPVALHDAFAQQAWPSVLGVLLEFCQSESTLFCEWKKTATFDFPKAHWEQFFIGKRRMGGKLMFDDARFSLDEYRRWGYLSREILINKAKRKECCSSLEKLETLQFSRRENRNQRVTQYNSVANSLACLSNEQLKQILANGKPMHEGIGGKSLFISIDNIPVFVKKVPLTDFEQLPQHFMSTASFAKKGTISPFKPDGLLWGLQRLSCDSLQIGDCIF